MTLVTPHTHHGDVEGPTPEKARLKDGYKYLVADYEGNCSPDYDGEAYVGVVNGDGELWYISNRHLRFLMVDGVPVDSLNAFTGV